MAVIDATQSGDFQVGSTWVGGVVPGFGDSCDCKNFLVTMQNGTIDLDGGSLIKTGTGQFSVADNATVILKANVIGSSTNGNSATVEVGDLQILLVTGDVTGGSIAGSPGVNLGIGDGYVDITGAVTGGGVGANSPGFKWAGGESPCHIIGNVTGGNVASSPGVDLYSSTGGELYVTGTVSGGNAGHGILSNADVYLYVTGTVRGAFGPGQVGFGIGGDSLGHVSITGDVHGGGWAASVYGVSAYDGWVTIVGNVYAGTATLCRGVYVSEGAVTITGNVTGGASSGGTGVFVNGDCTVIINGNLTGGTADEAVALRLNGLSAVVTGDAAGGTGAPAVLLEGAGISLTGQVRGALSNPQAGIKAPAGGDCTITIIGSVTGRWGHGIEADANTSISVSQNVVGGYPGCGISSTGLLTLTVNGDIVGGTGVNGHGVSSTGGGTIACDTPLSSIIGGSSAGAYGVYKGDEGAITWPGLVMGNVGHGLVKTVEDGIIDVGEIRGGAHDASWGIQAKSGVNCERNISGGAGHFAYGVVSILNSVHAVEDIHGGSGDTAAGVVLIDMEGTHSFVPGLLCDGAIYGGSGNNAYGVLIYNPYMFKTESLVYGKTFAGEGAGADALYRAGSDEYVPVEAGDTSRPPINISNPVNF